MHYWQLISYLYMYITSLEYLSSILAEANKCTMYMHRYFTVFYVKISCPIQQSFLFKTAHGAMKTWFYAAGGRKIKVQLCTKLNFRIKIGGLIVKVVLKERVVKQREYYTCSLRIFLHNKSLPHNKFLHNKSPLNIVIQCQRLLVCDLWHQKTQLLCYRRLICAISWGIGIECNNFAAHFVHAKIS